MNPSCWPFLYQKVNSLQIYGIRNIINCLSVGFSPEGEGEESLISQQPETWAMLLRERERGEDALGLQLLTLISLMSQPRARKTKTFRFHLSG